MVTKGQHVAADEKSVSLAKEASLHLLQRSIRFGHTRLSVLRLSMAARTGAVIPQECWDFCQHIVSANHDGNTQALFIEALQSASATSKASHPF